ncbi:hypothetical protein LIA77_09045 [Sarocladium implicatum]|nr:hypothetical protein LIA77_09045 [Sarocladium implicatum]
MGLTHVSLLALRSMISSNLSRPEMFPDKDANSNAKQDIWSLAGCQAGACSHEEENSPRKLVSRNRWNGHNSDRTPNLSQDEHMGADRVEASVRVSNTSQMRQANSRLATTTCFFRVFKCQGLAFNPMTRQMKQVEVVFPPVQPGCAQLEEKGQCGMTTYLNCRTP